MNFLPEASVLIAYCLAVMTLAVTPGPDMTLFIGKTISQGRLAGFVAFLGASTGLLFHTFSVAIGLSALLAASASAFFALKIAGCLYLLWLAFEAVRKGSSFSVDQATAKQDGMKAIFLKGLLINLLNPKIIVFFVTFLPQFVNINDPDAIYKLMFLGIVFVGVAAPVCGLLIIFADGISGFLKRSPKATRVVDWIFAAILGGFAVRLLLARSG